MSTPSASRAPYLGPARRRQPVLDAALAIFAEGGFDSASMAAIAARAGVAKAVLYDCFPGGKEELYSTLLTQLEEGFTTHLEGVLDQPQALSMNDALAAGLRAFLDYADVNPAGFRVVFGGAGTTNPTVVAGARRVREGIVARMRDTSVRRLHLKAEYEVAAELYARSVVAVAEELARWSIQRPELSRDALVQLTVTWFMNGFEALLPRPPLRRPRA